MEYKLDACFLIAVTCSFLVPSRHLGQIAITAMIAITATIATIAIATIIAITAIIAITTIIREFKDVVFEDVVFDNDICYIDVTITNNI